MSWKTIHQILGLAAIDKKFVQELLKEPLTALQERNFQLTSEEQRIFKKASASSLQELSQYLLRELSDE